jgi:hypothetical protein
MQFDKLLRPSPGIVIAALALFVSLGGTALAVTSINGNQLKNRSVAGIKLEMHTITGTEVNLNKLGKVPSAKHADSATNATNATNATSAGSATQATNANTANNALALGGIGPSGYQQSCDAGAVAGYAYVKGSSTFSGTYTSSAVAVPNQYNCSGGAVEVRRVSTGIYDVAFPGLPTGGMLIGAGDETVDTSGHPVVAGTITYSLQADANMTVYQVRRFNNASALTDGEFDFLLLR